MKENIDVFQSERNKSITSLDLEHDEIAEDINNNNNN